MSNVSTHTARAPLTLPAASSLLLEERLRGVARRESSCLITPEAFLSGMQFIKDREGRLLPAHVRAAQPHDAQQILSWYEPDTSDQPTYSDDPTWKEWWRDALQGKFQGVETLKLCLPDTDEALAFLAVKVVEDWTDNKAPTLYINGLRINPNLMPKDGTRMYSGTGSALISFAVIESIKRGLSGIGLNSSVGIEGFYRVLGLDEQPHLDGKRSYFSLKGFDKLAAFTEQRYQAALMRE